MKNNSNNTYIFSVDRANLPADENATSRAVASAVLRANGVRFKIADGEYEGSRELSFVVHGDASVESIVRCLTAGFHQDCYLKVDGYKQAWFINPIGGAEIFMGLFRSVSDTLLPCYRGSTRCGGYNYVIQPVEERL